MIAFALILGAVCTAVCCAVDPHNVFHALNMRYTGATTAQNYVKMKYILANPGKFDAFIMGSSRVGSLHPEKIANEKCYNMTYSEGVPHEHLANIRTLLRNGIIPKHIYMGVDSLSYTNMYENHPKTAYLVPYETSRTDPVAFWKLFLDPAYTVKAFFDTMLPASGRSTDNTVFYEYGWISDYGEKAGSDLENAAPSIGEADHMEDTLADLAEIVRICRENGIELTVFTNPMYVRTHEASVTRNYPEFLARLAEITPYFNFSGYNSITENGDNYLDSSHYNAETGDLMLHCLTGGSVNEALASQGFGAYITQDNAGQWISILSAE